MHPCPLPQLKARHICLILGTPVENVFNIYGVSRENPLEFLAVVSVI